MAYCTSIDVGAGMRIDLFTPTMFRLRVSTLAGDPFPPRFEIPFAIGRIEPWPPVPHRAWVDTFSFIETDSLRIRVATDGNEGMNFQVYPAGGGRRLFPLEGCGKGAGLFRDGCSVFDSASAFGEENRNSRYAHWFYNPAARRYDTFLAEDALLDTFFVYGPGYPALFAQVNELVGPEPLLPLKAFGFFQTQHLGRRGTQRKLLDAAERLRARRIPCDTLIVDYEWGDGFDGSSDIPLGSSRDWSPAYREPLDPDRLIAHLRERGFALMLIHHSVPGFPNRTAQGWTGTVCDEAEWWSALRQKLDAGLAGPWMDTRRNDVTDAMVWTGIQEHLGNRRVWCMSCYDMWETSGCSASSKPLPRDQLIGARRYPFRWTGDCAHTWEELAWQVRAITNTHGSLKAVSYLTNDCSARDHRLQARWSQFLSLSAVARSHTQKPWQSRWPEGPDPDYEEEPPGETAEDSIRSALGLRYRLLPYLYRFARQSYDTGLPITRPLLLAFPDDPACDRDQWPYEYLLGDAILVAPVLDDTGRTDVYLPAGADWVDFQEGTTHAGGRAVTLDTRELARIPIFVRAGAVITMIAAAETIDPARPWDPVELHVYPGPASESELYEDDGVSLGYRTGQCARTPIAAAPREGGVVRVTIGASSGSYPGTPGERTWQIVFHDRAARVREATCNGRPLVLAGIAPEAEPLGGFRVEVRAATAERQVVDLST